jgi:L-threonylcarbamoyladenylate synthase
VECLRAGEPVALPTETVYGLAANAFDPGSVRRIYEIKGRPAHNPIIVHVASLAMARTCVRHWPEEAGRLASGFWPGPLTLVLPRAASMPDVVTAGGDTVGVRWPSHPFIQAVIRECGFPLAAPSANLSSRVSPTTAEHVRRQLGGRVRLIVDGGPCQVGLESTVLDVTAQPPRILRPGMIREEALLSVIGALAVGDHGQQSVLRSPGQLQRHYSPRAKLRLFSWTSDDELQRLLNQNGVVPATCRVIAHSRIPSVEPFAGVSVMPHDPEAFARALYAELHRCDEQGAQVIVVEAVPGGDAWQAISDRLRRAAAW